MAVLISSQHLHEIEAISDKIVFLQQGVVTYNAPVTELGAARQTNNFELDTPCDPEELREHLKDLTVRQIVHNGMAYAITTPLHVDSRILLSRLMERGVEVEYFRDISRSVKQLFESSATATMSD